MPRRPASVTQADVTRAIKGTLAAGREVARVEIEGGKIVIVCHDDSRKAESANTFDKALS